MDSRELIDAQFDRAVEIVQNLPKTGPIQTDYEEKLLMYSLYKQATAGNVQGPRPSVWEMLARAKWDAWAKHKDLDQYEAKWLYVDALLKVLRKYSDKTVAMDLVRELESYGGDASNLVMSGSLTRSRSSSSSGSSSVRAGPSASHYSSEMPAHLRNNATNPMYMQYPQPEPRSLKAEDPTSSEGETDDEVRQPLPTLPQVRSHASRPQSSLSTHKYRTPMASVLMSPPPMSMSVPVPLTQPRPHTEAASVYTDHNSIPASAYPPSISTFPGGFSHPGSPPHHNPYNVQPPYHSASQLPYPVNQPSAPQGGRTPWPVLERAVANVQTNLAALHERIESLENAHHRSSSSLISQNGSRSPQWRGYGRSGSPAGRAGPNLWDIDDMGMWSLVLHPISRVQARFRQFMDFIMYNDNRSPTLVVIRRLFLDISFLLCLLAVMKMAWRRSGVRRKEVLGALSGLWWAIVGRKKPRIMVDRAVQ